MSPSPPAACKHVFLFVYFLLYLFQDEFRSEFRESEASAASENDNNNNDNTFPHNLFRNSVSININNWINFNYLIFIFIIHYAFPHWLIKTLRITIDY